MDRSKDIVLLSPPSRMINHYRPPLALIHIGGYLKKKNVEVKIVDVSMQNVVRNQRFWSNKNKLISQIKRKMLQEVEANPSAYIGISCYSPEFEEVKDLISNIKMISNAKIIVGGIHPTLCPDDFDGIADYVVRGRGEQKTYEILTGKTNPDETFDDVCVPDYSLVDMDYYCNANVYAIRGCFLRATYLLASFGCPSQCTFCAAKTLRHHFGIGQMRGTEYLLRDILYLKYKFLIDGFYFIDDLFTLNKTFVLEFCKYLKLYSTNLLWGCSSRVNTLDEEMIATMADSGCIQMDFGVERGSNEALKFLKKGQTIEQIQQTFNLCKKYKIRTFANMLVNIPGETSQDFRDIKNLLSNIQPDICSVNVFQRYEGVELIDKQPNKEVLEFARYTTRKYSNIWRNFKFHLTKKYLKCILSSKNKLNYLKQLWTLIQECINQLYQ